MKYRVRGSIKHRFSRFTEPFEKTINADSLSDVSSVLTQRYPRAEIQIRQVIEI